MVPACYIKVVQKHPSFLKLFQWTVKRLLSRKVTEMCHAHSFSFHSISLAKSAGELRFLGMEIKEHSLTLPAQTGNFISLSKYFSSSALIVESHLPYLRCNTVFEVQETVGPHSSQYHRCTVSLLWGLIVPHSHKRIFYLPFGEVRLERLCIQMWKSERVLVTPMRKIL